MNDDEMIEILYKHMKPFLSCSEVEGRKMLTEAFNEINKEYYERKKKSDAFYSWYMKTHD